MRDPTVSPGDSSGHELLDNWRIILAGMFGMMVSAASLPTYAIGAFVLPLHAAFGWRPPAVQAGIIFAQGGCSIAGLIMGALAARLGIRTLALSGIFGVSIGFALAALNPGSLVVFYLTFGLVALLGAGSVPVVWSRVMTGAFDRRRGLALALTLTGTGVAGVFVPSLLVRAIGAYGWRAGFWLLAALPLVVGLPAVLAWLPGDRALAAGQGRVVQAPPSQGLALGRAVLSWRFWLLLGSVIMLYLGITGILPNVIPAMISKGMAPADAALVQSAYAVTLVLGRLGVGWLVDRFWAPAVAVASLVPAALGSFLLTGHPGFGVAVLAIALVGVAGGAELDMLAYLVSRYFGLRAFSAIYGLLYAVVAATGAMGPFAFAQLQQVTGSYDICFEVAALLFAGGGGAIVFLGRYPRW
jgi:MFS transporter, OFA family, oxalate/formate antiporter